MRRLEDEREGTLKLLQDGLDELREVHALVGLRVVNVLCEDGRRLGVGLALELVAALLEDKTESSCVGDDTIVDDGELRLGVGLERVAVDDGGRSVGRPARVGDRDLGEEGLAGVYIGLGNLLAEASDLADLLEEEHLSRLVTVDTDTGGVVSTVLLTGETIAKDLANRFPVLEGKESDICICGTFIPGSLAKT